MTASKLVKPCVDYKNSFLEALSEYHAEGRYVYFDKATIEGDFDAFLKTLNTRRGHEHRPYQDWEDPVPETVLWLVKDGQYLGSVDIRHRLNWHLEKWGGHIHFIIRPSMRNKGFGKKLLQKAIPFANYLGIERALMTVAPDNVPALRIVEACGAQFEDETPAIDRFPARRRYWLDCT